MMKQKLLSMGLALALMLCQTVPAWAVEDTPPDETAASVENDGMEVTESVEQTEPVEVTEPVEETEPVEPVPTSSEEGTAEELEETPDAVDVSVPVKSRLILNPYRIEVEFDGKKSSEPILSCDEMFTSSSGAPVLVNAVATGEASEGVRFVPSMEELDSLAKDVFVWVEFRDPDDDSAWSGTYTGAPNQIVVNGDASNVLTLPAASGDAPSAGVFRAFGALGVPSEIDNMWTADDSVNVSIQFVFTPLISDANLEEVVDEVSGVDVADDASGAEEPVDVAGDASGVEKIVDDVDDVSDVEEAVDVADEASNVEEPVDVADDASDLVKPTVGEPPKPIDIDEASDVEETVDVADEASNVEEAVDDVDDVSDVVQPTIGEPPIPMDVDEASGVEEAVDVVDEASDVEEAVDVVDEASDVEEPVDVADEASDVEEPVDVTDEASDVEEPVDAEEDAKKPDEGEELDDIDVEESVDDVDEASDVEESADDVDEVSETN